MKNSVPQDVIEDLNVFAATRQQHLKAAPWLITDFDSPIWEINVGGRKSIINWNVRFGNGKLTDRKYIEMRTLFGSFLILQTHPVLSRGHLTNHDGTRSAINRGIRQIDYFLLNQDELSLSDFGFSLITENDLLIFLNKIETERKAVNSIYAWQSRLTNYLLQQAEQRKCEIDSALQEVPELADIDEPCEDWVLDISKDDLIRCRAALWVEGLYEHSNNARYKLIPSVGAVSIIFYSDTLRGMAIPKPLYPELCIGPAERNVREWLGVPVRSCKEFPTREWVRTQRATLFSLRMLEGAGHKVPVAELNICDARGLISPENLPSTGRFSILPFRIIIESIRRAVEFILEHGEHLIDSYAAVLVAADAYDVSASEMFKQSDLTHLLLPKTIAMGVVTWNITFHSAPEESGELLRQKVKFARIRAHQGLVNSMRILFGAMQTVFGAMSARRQGELVDISLRDGFDSLYQNVIFANRKSGSNNVRQKECRPIPPICSEIVKLRLRLSDRLGATLGSKVYCGERLFDSPTGTGLCVASTSTFNAALDSFSDYIETPIDSESRRYYMRQHQLRKFFALAFFYGASWSNTHTVRWMLGHIDGEHLWHYLTTDTPGEVLREVSSFFVTDMLQNFSLTDSRLELSLDALEYLEATVESQFGTRKFSIIDNDALQAFIFRMAGNGLKIEPHFLIGPGDKSYKIAVTLY